MLEKETIKYIGAYIKVKIVAYIKVKIAEAELKKSDCEYPKDAITQEGYMDACSRLGALNDVLRELGGYYRQETR